MRIWFDTEFIEDGKTIDLISIGMIDQNGLAYYAENADCELWRAGLWVQENVIPHLVGGKAKIPKAQIADEIGRFAGVAPEFWAYYADYDWVVLCQLYGRMIDLPDSWPMFCRDVKQLSEDRGRTDFPPRRKGPEHHAFSDAVWCKLAWEYVVRQAPAPDEGAG